jgi:hydrogenase maturation factor
MVVRRNDEARGLALCEDSTGARHTVETALVEPVADGDVLLVHAGTAIQALDGLCHDPTVAWRRPAAPDRHPPEGPVATATVPLVRAAPGIHGASTSRPRGRGTSHPEREVT